MCVFGSAPSARHNNTFISRDGEVVLNENIFPVSAKYAQLSNVARLFVSEFEVKK